MSISITAMFIGVFVLLRIPLTVMVGYRRARTGIQFFDGGDQLYCVAYEHTATTLKPVRSFSSQWQRQSSLALLHGCSGSVGRHFSPVV
jgi:hypothetical protein